MPRKILVVTLSILIGWFGLLAVGGAILRQDINLVLRIIIFANGMILFIGMGSLLNNNMAAVKWLFVSLILYYLTAWYDRVLTYGWCSIILPFIAQFYWSLGMRFLFAVAAYALIRDSAKEGV